MTKNLLSFLAVAIVAALAGGLAGCAEGDVEVVEEFAGVLSFTPGWTHTCTLQCTNAQTGATDTIGRLGRNANGSAVCKDTRVTCSAGRSAACTNAANAVNNNEPLYSGCVAVAFGTCTRTCAQVP